MTLSACGYRLGVVPCEGFSSVKTVGVPLFLNRSFAPRAEDIFTTTFRESVQALPCVKLRPADEAEALLKGTIWTVETYPVAVDPRFLALEYGLRLVLSVSLERRDDDSVIWKTGRMQDEIHFYASPADTRPGYTVPYRPADPLLYQINEREAMIKLSRRMSSRVMDMLQLGFEKGK